MTNGIHDEGKGHHEKEKAKEIKKVKENIEREDLLEIARSSRLSTAWKVEAVICIRFDVMRIQL